MVCEGNAREGWGAVLVVGSRMATAPSVVGRTSVGSPARLRVVTGMAVAEVYAFTICAAQGQPKTRKYKLCPPAGPSTCCVTCVAP